MGMLKNVKRSGWFMAGIKNPETIAEHKLRAIIIGYVLAKLEKANDEKVIKMLMFHDIPETRLGDMHKVTANYLDKEPTEQKIIEDQAKLLPEDARKEFLELMKEFNEKSTKESIIARDADYLEAAVQAHEYIESGYKNAQEWIDRIRLKLKTEPAKQILEEVLKSENWWKGLKKVEW